jgi:hypothetical protein
MRLKAKTIVITVVAFILLTVFPILIQGYLPEEVYTYLSKTAGIDLKATLNNTAILGLFITATFILGDLYERNTLKGLIASTFVRVIWFTVTTYTLSLGDLTHMGLATIGSGTGTTYNLVVIDLRLFIILAAVITALKITFSTLDYNLMRPR